MGKLVIRYQGKQVGEVNLKLGDTRIGRKPGCDIVLNDAGVSGVHAVIKTVGMKSTLYDLDSTNGTFIENERVRKRELKHGETIVMGEHTLYYRDDPNLEPPTLGKRPAPPAPPAVQDKTVVLTAIAQLLAIEGKNKGKPVPLVKDEVTLENPGKNPARIYRTSDGYLLQAQVGPGEPRLNDKPVPPGGHLLENGDIIEVAGTKFQFLK
ncbi:signal peptide protein [Sulfurifustis variabilis]|uniref:Signal peptide protein n=1 Tax=Sulfurifustis variabilis TaxID=1675686 RepID=A0A1B4V1W4_9GAMM|nr:FHA domain-containing protein [Sulfurifustis variabilis]BAU47498.1 signal peptide protein [Sulfurifustis variabilis]